MVRTGSRSADAAAGPGRRRTAKGALDMGADFEEVWRRVTGAQGQEAHSGTGEAERLERFIREEAGTAERYARLTKACSGAVQKLYRDLAAEEREHLHSLQTALYLLRGDSKSCPQEPKQEGGSRAGLRELRERYAAERTSAAAYASAAAETRDSSLRRLYDKLAKAEEKHAERIWSLAQRLV